MKTSADRARGRAVIALDEFVKSAPRSKSMSPARRRIIARSFPEVLKLAQTFPVFAEAESRANGRNRAEWNPVSSRPYWPAQTPSSFPVLDRSAVSDAPPRYNEYALIAERFSEAAHELMHIALWEPFFTGEHNWLALPEEAFVRLNLAAEGFCFWYADMRVMRDLQKNVLNDATLENRCVGFGTVLHPRQTLEEIGLRTEREQVDFYVALFQKDAATALRNGPKKWEFIRDRVLLFALAADPVMARLGRHLRESQIGSEFFERFCAREGIPALFTHGGDPTNSSDYVARFARDVLPKLETLKTKELERVYQRRKIQGRAYFLLQLAWALRNRRLAAGRDGGVFSSPTLERGIQKAVDTLSSALERVCAGDRHADAGIRQVDSWWASKRTSLKKSGVFVAARRQILPFKNVEGVFEFGLTRFNPESGDDRLTAMVESIAPHLGDVMHVPATVLAALGTWRTARPAARAEAFDRLLSMKAVREVWTCDIADVDLREPRTMRELNIHLV